jgi:hypothetical protein
MSSEGGAHFQAVALRFPQLVQLLVLLQDFDLFIQPLLRHCDSARGG